MSRSRRTWTRSAARILVVTLATLLVATPVVASSTLALSPADLFRRADRVVYGVVEDVAPGPEGRTVVTLRIERDLTTDAADAPDATRPASPTLTIPYGAPDATVRIADVEAPKRGDRVLLALSGDDDAVSPVVGLWQGAWTVTSDGLRDLRGRRLEVAGRALRLGTGAPDPDADGSVERVLNALADALTGGEIRLSETTPDVGDGEPLPPVPDAPAETARAEDAPYVLSLALPDDAGLGPTLEAAAAAWTAAGRAIEIREDPDAADRVVFVDPQRTGPDVRVLLAQADGRPGVEFWIPTGRDLRPDALAQAIGRRLGLPPGPTGFAAGLLPADDRVRPDATDADALDRRLRARQGDLDGDGDVDLHDLATVAEAYGREGVALPADLDGSGRVDDADLDVLRDAYEFLPPDRSAP